MDRCVKKVKKNAKVVSGWCSRYEGGYCKIFSTLLYFFFKINIRRKKVEI